MKRFSLLAALAACLGIGHAPASQMVIRPSHAPDPDGHFYPGSLTRTSKSLKGRVAQNQRQRRKDRRRAHAAGVRHAFS